MTWWSKFSFEWCALSLAKYRSVLMLVREREIVWVSYRNPKVRILSLSSLSPSKAFPPLLLLLTTYTSISIKTHSFLSLLTASPLPKPIIHDPCLYSLPPSLPHTYLTHPSPSRFHFFFTTNLIANIHIKKTFSHHASSPTPPSLH